MTRIVVISGPSGVGKSTLGDRLTEALTGLVEVRSHTTRPMRRGESEGRPYHFIGREEFERMRAAQAFIEHITYPIGAPDAHHYGLARATVANRLQLGHALAIVDGRGFEQLQDAYGDRVLGIFLAPPSKHELRRRMEERGNNDHDIYHRLESYRAEMALAHLYDYVLSPLAREALFAEAFAIVQRYLRSNP